MFQPTTNQRAFSNRPRNGGFSFWNPRIEDTWYVAGLKGTGSHHIALRETLVPAANFFDFIDGAACLPGPLYQAVPQLVRLLHGASSVGMAEGALDELVALANTGRQQLGAPVPMRDSEIFQANPAESQPN
jgi:alkylation response protein AidB-like acyl-CoA dehydrogenase